MLETILSQTDEFERCGFVLDDDTIVEIKNIAEDPTNGYEMDPREALEHIESARGTWHTHPKSDPTLSGEDQKGFLAWPNLLHTVIGWRDGKPLAITYRVEDGLVIECD